MKKYSAFLAACLLAALASGCAGADTAPALPEESAVSQSVGYTAAAYVDEEQEDKTETVYIDSAADGAPQKVTVEGVLKNPGGSDPITDECALQDLKNAEGDEEFTQSGTHVEWQNHGEDIHYKGTASGDLPVGVKIEYFLNGSQVSPESLAGKSGHVTMRFTYENRETRTIRQAGKNYEVCVPFTAVSLVSLPEDSFYNVKVDNGKAMNLSGSVLVLGYALPGLADSLRLADYEPLEDVSIPESVEIECDTTDFALDFTATVFSPGLLAEEDLSDLTDVEDFIRDMDEAKENISDLADATRELDDGVGELLDGVSEYVDGVGEVNDGVQTLIDALRDSAKSDSEMIEGVSALSSGWIAVLAQFLNAPDLNAENYADRLPEAIQSYSKKTAESSVRDSLQALAASMAGWPQNESDPAFLDIPAEMQPVFGGEDKIAAQTAQALSYALFTDSLHTAYCQRILANAAALLSENEQEAALQTALIGWISNRYALMQGAESGDSSQLGEALSESETAAYGALCASAADSLSQGLAPLVKGTAGLPGSLSGALEEMADSVGKLKEGTQALFDAGNELKDGIGELKDGTGEFADGVSDFEKDDLPALTDLAGDGLQALVDRVRCLQKADLGYACFSGLPDGKTGSVRFIFETEEIKSE